MNQHCGVTGKQIYPTKDMARLAVKVLKGRYKGRASAKRCVFGDHYHVTKGLRGQKGKRDFR